MDDVKGKWVHIFGFPSKDEDFTYAVAKGDLKENLYLGGKAFLFATFDCILKRANYSNWNAQLVKLVALKLTTLLLSLDIKQMN